MSSSRGNVGFVIVFAFVAVAAIMVLASALRPADTAALGGAPGAQDTFTRLGAGGSVPLSPLPMDVTPVTLDIATTTVDGIVSIDQGYSGPSPLGGGGPGPSNPPFLPDRRVTSNVNFQGHPSIAAQPGGAVIYIAYTNQTTPTNRDVYVARSADGGVTWTHIPVAAAPYNEFEPRIVMHGTRVVVFFANDDINNNRGFRRAESTDQGLTWAITAVNYGGPPPIRDFIRPDASSYNGQWLYAIYETFCDVPASCGGGTSRVFLVAMFDSAMVLGTNSVYFPFIAAPNVPLPSTEPAIIANQDQTLWIGDADARNLPGGGPGAHDVLWIQTPTGQNTGSSWAGGFITQTYSSDSVRVDAAGFQPNFILAYQFVNATLGIPNHAILDLYSQDSGATWTLDLVAGLPGVEFKDPAVFARSPNVYATFYQGGDLGYANSSDAAVSWSMPLKVNSNTGTIADGVRTNDITYDPSLGPVIAWEDSRDGNANVYTTQFQQFAVTLLTSPVSNLNVRVDADAYAAAPVVKNLVAGTSHQIQAQTPQAGGSGQQYVFVRWDDGSTANPRTITVSGAATYTAVFLTQYQITVASTPPGRTVAVNNATQTASYAFWCDAGKSAYLEAPSPQTLSPTSQYRFDSWTDGGAQAHAIACTGTRTITANFVLQWQVTVASNPPALEIAVSGTVHTASYVFWCDDTSSVTISAPSPQAAGPGTQYRFDSWSDGQGISHPITCTAASTYTANFVRQFYITIGTNPAGRTVNVGGTGRTGPYSNYYDEGSSIGLLVPTPQNVGATSRFSFSAWSDGNVNPSRTIIADQPRTLTAIFTTEYFLTISTNVGTVNPGNGWHPEDDIVAISTTGVSDGATDRYRFGGWTGDLIWYAPSTTITMNGPKTIAANWVHQYKIDVRFAAGVPGTLFTIDGQDVGANTFWWNESSTHSVAAPATIPATSDTRYNFASWQGAATRQFDVTVSNAVTYTAQYTRQYLVTLTITPSGPTVTVDGLTPTGALWFDDGTTHAFDANANPQPGGTGERFRFGSWTGAGTGSNPVLSLSVDGPKVLTAGYVRQFLVTVNSQYGTWTCVPPGVAIATGCWYDENTQAQITVTTPVTAGGTKYRVTGWTGASGTTTATVTVDAPKTITATWAEVSFIEEFGLYLGLLIAILVAVIGLVLFLVMRRRKKEPPAMAMPPPPPPMGMQETRQVGGTKTCPACGMEIPGSATQCPVCGSAL